MKKTVIICMEYTRNLEILSPKGELIRTEEGNINYDEHETDWELYENDAYVFAGLYEGESDEEIIQAAAHEWGFPEEYFKIME